LLLVRWRKSYGAVIDASLKAAVVPKVPNPAVVAARRKCIWNAVARCSVLSERFRGRGGETSRKAGCSSWARPV